MLVGVRGIVCSLAVSLVMLSAMVGQIGAQSEDVGATGLTIVSPGEDYAGVSAGEWEARWWQWLLSFPTSVNPGRDPSGARCGWGQAGPFFFLPTTLTPDPLGDADPIACVVPAGVAVFVPVGSVSCSTAEPPPFFGQDEAELRACAAALAGEATDIRVTVDGMPIPDIADYRTVSPLFPVSLPEDNILGVGPGVASVVSVGHGLIIVPPPLGTWHVSASTLFAGTPDPQFTAWRLIVTPSQLSDPDAIPPDATPVGCSTDQPISGGRARCQGSSMVDRRSTPLAAGLGLSMLSQEMPVLGGRKPASN